jgi:3-oxoacyl-[acyl-carrier protein] reductase
LAGKNALVTGGAAGIGRAIAAALAAEGARVMIWDLAKAAPGKGGAADGHGEVQAMVVDISNAEQVKKASRQVSETWGDVDILVNNAGICRTTPIEAIPAEEWDLILSVNLKGTFLCAQAFMGGMKKRRRGKIINLGSLGGKTGGLAVGAHYAASKAAVMCFTKSLARELAAFDVQVNAIAPGIIETDMTRGITGGDWSQYLANIPMGRIGTGAELAAVAVFLASAGSSYITGETIDVNGGFLMD